ncbi:MAG: HD domain-containing phosphohydrolase [Thermodesulfovibrionales bacterium]
MKNERSVLVVDDDISVRELLVSIIGDAGYNVADADSAEEAVKLLADIHFHLVVSDIKMPRMSGIELLKAIKQLNPDIPVILVTGFPDIDMTIESLKLGAHDFILKPFQVEYVLHAVDKAIEYYETLELKKKYNERLEATVRERTLDLQDAVDKLKSASQEIIARLTFAAEYKDRDTASHISRIGRYSRLMAEELKKPSDFVESIEYSSPMHDVGKIGIPDSILMKPDKLTPEEFEIAKTHSEIGAKILQGSDFPVIQMASSIALYHHERWDGTGYPKGLKGEKIPLEGRIVMLVDQYDALRAERPYKESISHEQVYKIITEGDGRTLPKHFDPDVLSIFKNKHNEFEAIFRNGA